MTQQFKFGDIVRFASEPTQIGVVFEVTDKNIQIGWNDGYTSFQKHDDPLELIPHPDTVRLDFMLKNQFVATLSEDTDDDFFIVQAQLSR